MTDARPAEIPVFFYRTSGGAEPVLDWLRSLPPEDIALARKRMKAMRT
jgi:hypothetical protein